MIILGLAIVAIGGVVSAFGCAGRLVCPRPDSGTLAPQLPENHGDRLNGQHTRISAH